MLAKSCSLFIYYQKGPVGGPGTLLTEGVYESELGITMNCASPPSCRCGPRTAPGDRGRPLGASTWGRSKCSFCRSAAIYHNLCSDIFRQHWHMDRRGHLAKYRCAKIDGYIIYGFLNLIRRYLFTLDLLIFQRCQKPVKKFIDQLRPRQS